MRMLHLQAAAAAAASSGGSASAAAAASEPPCDMPIHALHGHVTQIYVT